MSKNNTLPAFTIVEALVSMAVTAIVLGIIFLIFTIASERLIDFKKENEHINDLNRMTYSLNKSIFENDKMHIRDNELVFTGKVKGNTTYSFSEDFLIRTSNDYMDTFKLNIQEYVIDTLASKNKRHLYQRLRCSIRSQGRKNDFTFFKKIYPAELIILIRKDEF